MGVGRPVLPSAFRSRTSEDTVSLGPEAPQPPSGSRTGRGALVATALALAAVLGRAVLQRRYEPIVLARRQRHPGADDPRLRAADSVGDRPVVDRLVLAPSRRYAG